MKVIVVSNLKGGVGKTATAHALGAVLAEDRRVLLVDADPQSSLTRACGIADADGRSLAEVMDGRFSKPVSLRETIRDLGNGLALVPSDPLLSTVEIELRSRQNRESVLKSALSSISNGRSWARRFTEYSEAGYDVAIVDTPPNFGLLTINALAAGDAVLIPVVPEIVSFESLRIFFDKLRRVRQSLNPSLTVLGVLPTFYDSRLVHHKAILEVMRAQGYPVMDVTVGRSIRVAEAASADQSVVTYAPDNKRALEYWVLGNVVRGWLDDQKE